MACDVVPLCACRSTIFPLASEAQVIGALAANVVVAQVAIESFGIGESHSTIGPLAWMGILGNGRIG